MTAHERFEATLRRFESATMTREDPQYDSWSDRKHAELSASWGRARAAVLASADAMVAEAVAGERKECATIAELHSPPYDGTTDTRQIHGANMASRIAAAIRART